MPIQTTLKYCNRVSSNNEQEAVRQLQRDVGRSFPQPIPATILRPRAVVLIKTAF